MWPHTWPAKQQGKSAEGSLSGFLLCVDPNVKVRRTRFSDLDSGASTDSAPSVFQGCTDPIGCHQCMHHLGRSAGTCWEMSNVTCWSEDQVLESRTEDGADDCHPQLFVRVADSRCKHQYQPHADPVSAQLQGAWSLM